MKEFYCYFSRPSYLIVRFCLAAFIYTMTYMSVVAQDFTAITWSTVAAQKYAVSEAQGRVVNDKLYSFGGFDSQKSTFTPTKRAYVYDPANNTWSAIADLPHIPNGQDFGGVTHAGVTTDGTDIFIAGGYTSNSSGTGQIFGTKQVWKYIVSQNVYTKLPDLPISIAAGQLEYLNGKLHYVGGTNSARTLDLGNHYVLEVNNLTAGWKTLASLPNPRHHAGSAVYKGKLYFIGGQHNHDAELVTQKDVHVFDPINNRWSKLADLPVPSGASGRAHISSGAVVMGERIIVLAGEIAHQSSISIVSSFSPVANSWTDLTPLPKNRFSGVAGVMKGNIFYTGGNSSNITYKGVPEGVILSSQPSSPATSEDSSGRNLKKPVVFPNPLKTKFNVRFPVTYSGNFSFKIVNLSGRTYNMGKVKIERGGSNISFDISKFSLPAGMYFLKIKSEIKSDELKLVVK